MRFFYILVVMLCSTPSWAYEVCPKKKLVLKDCLFAVGQNKVHVWHDKILLNSQVGRDAQLLSIQSDLDKGVVDWQFARIKKIGGRNFLELGIWTPPKGEGEVESLIWSVYEIKAGELTKLLEKTLQKRKRLEGLESEEKKYKLDRILKYGIENKKSRIYWQLGHEQGDLK